MMPFPQDMPDSRSHRNLDARQGQSKQGPEPFIELIDLEDLVQTRAILKLRWSWLPFDFRELPELIPIPGQTIVANPFEDTGESLMVRKGAPPLRQKLHLLIDIKKRF